MPSAAGSNGTQMSLYHDAASVVLNTHPRAPRAHVGQDACEVPAALESLGEMACRACCTRLGQWRSKCHWPVAGSACTSALDGRALHLHVAYVGIEGRRRSCSGGLRRAMSDSLDGASTRPGVTPSAGAAQLCPATNTNVYRVKMKGGAVPSGGGRWSCHRSMAVRALPA